MADESSGSEPELTDVRAAPGLAVAGSQKSYPSPKLRCFRSPQKDFNGFNVWGFQFGKLRGW